MATLTIEDIGTQELIMFSDMIKKGWWTRLSDYNLLFLEEAVAKSSLWLKYLEHQIDCILAIDHFGMDCF